MENLKVKKKLTIAFDLDGTLAQYDGYKGPFVFGPPVTGMKELFMKLQEEGHNVGVYSCRNDDEVLWWCNEYGLQPSWINKNMFLDIDCPNKPYADIYIDDKCIKFDGNAKDLEWRIDNFKEWWKE